MEKKSIVQLYAQKQEAVPKDWNTLLQENAKFFPELQGVINIHGDMLASTPFLRAFRLGIADEKGKDKNLVALIFPVLNKDVLLYCTQMAKSNMINGILGASPNVLLAKDMKVGSGPLPANK